MVIQKSEDREPKFKNKHAAKLYEKLKNKPLSKKKKQDADYISEFDRQMAKYLKGGEDLWSNVLTSPATAAFL